MERLGEERGAGGKLRKPPSRKPPSTPYSRPPPPPSQAGAEAGGRRWISKLVDPAYRLISSGATRIFPSLFSKPDSIDALPAPTPQNHRKFNSLSLSLNLSLSSSYCERLGFWNGLGFGTIPISFYIWLIFFFFLRGL